MTSRVGAPRSVVELVVYYLLLICSVAGRKEKRAFFFPFRCLPLDVSPIQIFPPLPHCDLVFHGGAAVVLIRGKV